MVGKEKEKEEKENTKAKEKGIKREKGKERDFKEIVTIVESLGIHREKIAEGIERSRGGLGRSKQFGNHQFRSMGIECDREGGSDR